MTYRDGHSEYFNLRTVTLLIFEPPVTGSWICPIEKYSFYVLEPSNKLFLSPQSRYVCPYYVCPYFPHTLYNFKNTYFFQDKTYFNKNNNFSPQILRHTSTHPNALSEDIFNHYVNYSNIRGEHSSPPRMLRRTNKSKELIKEDKNDLNGYFNLIKEENFPIEEMERLAEQLKCSRNGYKQQPQKIVKFAETVEVI